MDMVRIDTKGEMTDEEMVGLGYTRKGWERLGCSHDDTILLLFLLLLFL